MQPRAHTERIGSTTGRITGDFVVDIVEIIRELDNGRGSFNIPPFISPTLATFDSQPICTFRRDSRNWRQSRPRGVQAEAQMRLWSLGVGRNSFKCTTSWKYPVVTRDLSPF